MGRYRWKDFLSMDVMERNLVIDISASIKRELKQHFTLRELGFRGSWDNIDLNALLSLTEERVEKIFSHKRIKSKSKILRSLEQLFSIMGFGKSLPDRERTLDTWLEG